MISVNPSYMFHLLPPNKLNPPPGNTDSVPPQTIQVFYRGHKDVQVFPAPSSRVITQRWIVPTVGLLQEQAQI